MAAKKAAAGESGGSASGRNAGKKSASSAEQAWQTLRESHDELRAVYDGMFDGLLIADHETKGFLRANPAICEMLGYSEEELLGMSVADIHPSDVLPHVFEQFAAMVEGRQSLAEGVPFRRKDGSAFFADVVVRAHEVTYGERPCAIAFIRDVSERKRADDALRRERDFSTTLLQASPTFFVAISGTGRTLMMNEAMLTALGYTEDEVLGSDYLETFVPKADHKSLALVFRKVVDAHEPTISENRVLTKDGRELLVEWHGRPIFKNGGELEYFFGVGIDITERRRAEEELARHRDHLEELVEERTSKLADANRELRESKERFRTLFETNPDGIVEVDPSGNILVSNRAYQKMLGYGEAELSRMNVAELIPEQQRISALSDLGTTADELPEPTPYEVQHITRDGKVIDCEVAWAYRYGLQAEVVGFVCVVTDVTETKRAAEALQKEQQLLRQLLNLHEQERKLVAYEIHDGLAQQLIGALLQFQSAGRSPAECVPRSGRGFDVGVRLLNDCINETRRLISGLRPPILDEEGVVAAIRYLINEHEKRGGPKIEFVHEFEVDRLAPVLETAIFRIVQETLNNACRYSQSENVRVELVVRNGHIHVEVRDWGIGFDPSQIPEDHFGLQGVRERARLLGGQAVIDTTLDKGSQIMVELPLLEQVASQADSAFQ